jgi:outer membrane protein insertion porin family
MVDTSYNFAELRYSTGVSLNWFSPVGPLKLSFGIPLKKEPTDRLQRIQFTLGTIF